jgi:hypothetical protein
VYVGVWVVRVVNGFFFPHISLLFPRSLSHSVWSGFTWMLWRHQIMVHGVGAVTAAVSSRTCEQLLQAAIQLQQTEPECAIVYFQHLVDVYRDRCPDAMGLLAWAHIDGLGIEARDRNIIYAANLALTGRDLNSWIATSALAMCHHMGHGMPADKAQAQHLFQLAADHGDPRAITFLARQQGATAAAAPPAAAVVVAVAVPMALPATTDEITESTAVAAAATSEPVVVADISDAAAECSPSVVNVEP